MLSKINLGAIGPYICREVGGDIVRMRPALTGSESCMPTAFQSLVVNLAALSLSRSVSQALSQVKQLKNFDRFKEYQFSIASCINLAGVYGLRKLSCLGEAVAIFAGIGCFVQLAISVLRKQNKQAEKKNVVIVLFFQVLIYSLYYRSLSSLLAVLPFAVFQHIPSLLSRH